MDDPQGQSAAQSGALTLRQEYGEKSEFGKKLFRKYAGSTRFVKAATSPREVKKLQQMAAIFRKYGARYDLDYLLMMAQGYQESRLDQNARSAAGAIGVMQIMPATGKDLNTATRDPHASRNFAPGQNGWASIPTCG